jgi:tRNA A37 threonylcarbamoyladenosine biosynthesis protein TsaE
VEWGDAVAELLATDRLRVELVAADPSGADDARRIVVTPEGSGWRDRWDALASALDRWRESRS